MKFGPARKRFGAKPLQFPECSETEVNMKNPELIYFHILLKPLVLWVLRH